MANTDLEGGADGEIADLYDEIYGLWNYRFINLLWHFLNLLEIPSSSRFNSTKEECSSPNESSIKTMEIEEKSISSAKWQNYTSELKISNFWTLFALLDNFYRLLLTARKEIKRCKDEAETSNKRQVLRHHKWNFSTFEFRATGRLLVSCPSCSQTFSSGEHRFMPSYIKVLRGSNRLVCYKVTILLKGF